MTLQVDGSSPAGARGATSTVSTGAFSPPGSALLLAFVDADANNGNASEQCTVTSTGGLSWTLKTRANGSPGATAEVWYAITTGAPGSITVSVTDNQGAVDMSLFVRVLTDTNGGTPAIGATAFSATTTTSYTSTVANSWGWCTGIGAAGTPVAGSGQTIQDSAASFDGGDAVWTVNQNAVTATAGTTVNNGTTNATVIHQIAVEILPGVAGVPAGPYGGPAPGRISPTGKWAPTPGVYTSAAAQAATGVGDAPAHPNTTAATIKQAAAAGVAPPHATTTTSTSKAATATTAAGQRTAVAATGGKVQPSGSATASQRNAVAATGIKAPTATTAATQRATTQATGAKQATAATTTGQRSTDTATGAKQATGTAATPTRPATRATTSPSGAAAALAHPATTAAGKAATAGAARSSPRATTTSAGKAGDLGAARATAHAITAAVSGRLGTGTAAANQRAVTAAAGFAPLPFEPAMVGVEGSTLAGSVDATTQAGTVDAGTTATGAPS